MIEEAERISHKLARKKDKGTFFSFEYFPPRTDMGAVNLISMFDRMSQMKPLFIDITWSAGGSKTDRTLELVKQTQQLCCVTVNMHLTCNNSTREELLNTLMWCKKHGISNIMALRGDPPRDPNWREEDQEFHHAIDLVKLIREEFGDFFCISVAGYPYLHPDCESVEQDILNLKAKVDAGADFVVSQLFFRAEDFLSWRAKCREAGITVPILPGILPIQGYASLRNLTKMCCIPVPDEIMADIEPIKEDDAAILDYGISACVDVCRKLIEAGVPGLHFYTLNREIATTKILHELQLVQFTRELPWSKSVVGKRGNKEDVRPIYWANRMMSYLSRTEQWDQFPNGRWGDNRNPAFGDLTDYHIFLHQKPEKPSELRKIWGNSLESNNDIGDVFVNFLKGNIDKLPWISTPVLVETGRIMNTLIDINQMGFWSINSQPSINGVSSDHAKFGWGPSGGYVYQKAYVEFFCSPTNLEKLEELVLYMEPTFRFNYQAIDQKGNSRSNISKAMAVTWGVFPGQQIAQPTVVDPVSFKVWSEEAFSLWLQWQGIYEDEESRGLISEIYNTYYLVTLVDNDFVSGEFFSSIFTQIYDE